MSVMVSLIAGEALMPNRALKPFDAFIGVWQTIGTHPYLSGKTLHGRTSFAWHEGGAFVIMHSEIDESEIPSGVAIFGSDDKAGTYFMIYFDERGVSRKYDVAFTHDRLMWHRDEPSFSQRFTITIEGGGDRMKGTGEMSRDGAPWEDDLSLHYQRVEPFSEENNP
jgi:hypothetical protein